MGGIIPDQAQRKSKERAVKWVGLLQIRRSEKVRRELWNVWGYFRSDAAAVQKRGIRYDFKSAVLLQRIYLYCR